MRIFVSLVLVLVLAAGSIAAPVMAIPSENTMSANKIVVKNDLQLAPPLTGQDNPYSPRRDDIIGETMLPGDTYYDYQSNGCIGKMIALDNAGNIHITWMDGFTVDNAGTRHQKYNFLQANSEDWLEEDGVVIDESDRSGYGALTLCETDENGQRAIPFFHGTGGPFPDDDATWAGAIDWDIGWGAFITTIFPTYPDGATVAWPRGVMSVENGSIHVVGNDLGGEEGTPGRVSYMLAHLDMGEITADLEIPSEVGETHLNTYQIARSPVSNKAVIVWPNTRTENPAPAEWEGFAAWQMNNDLFMAWTDDGENWNFDDPYNITDCIMPDRLLDDPECYGDTLLPYCTFDVIIDEQDVTHVVFEVRGLWWDPNWSAEDDEAPPLRRTDDAYLPGLTVDASYLYHWDEDSREFSVVADGWFFHYVVVDDTIRSHPTPGAWKSNVCYPSLAYADNGNLYCAYNYYPENDFNDYIGDYGRCNGDVAITVSDDDGLTWYEPTPVVQTSSHLAEPGQAECEEYPSLAERVDDYLHLFYIVDREAGTEIQDSDGGAANTLNPVVYQKISVDDILMDVQLADMPPFHVGEEPPDTNMVGQQTPWTPSGFRLNGAYPNPFNSATSIEFEVKLQQNVKLEAFNINGQKVAELFAGEVLAGNHRINWEANDMTTGVYIVKLTSAESTAAIKVALVK
ncbi:T9SS type A sorting domain-containing protein [bacterium]|nr:T9SS type A sorting domain-containing protein [bacterium]